jgi:hypothetical protein
MKPQLLQGRITLTTHEEIRQQETQHVKESVLEIMGEGTTLPSDEDIALYLHGWTPEATITLILQDYFGMRF